MPAKLPVYAKDLKPGTIVIFRGRRWYVHHIRDGSVVLEDLNSTGYARVSISLDNTEDTFQLSR